MLNESFSKDAFVVFLCGDGCYIDSSIDVFVEVMKVDDFMNGAVQIILAAMKAGWSVNWQGNEMVLRFPVAEKE